MLSTFYTWAALADEWDSAWRGARLVGAHTQQKGELVLELEGAGGSFSLRVNVLAPLRYAMETGGHHRAKRNVVDLFPSLKGYEVESVRVADRDRMLFIELSGGTWIQVQLFGPRPNIFVVDSDGSVRYAFKSDDKWRGMPAPGPRPAPLPGSAEEMWDRWPGNRRTIARAVSSVWPLFDTLLADEVCSRAGVDGGDSVDCGAEVVRRLHEAVLEVEAAMADPSPRAYEVDGEVDAFSLTALRHREGDVFEVFDTVGEAVRSFVRRRLGRLHFEHAYRPVRQALDVAFERLVQRTEAMAEEMARPSRADRYERWGHLLMASLLDVAPGSEEIELPNLFEGGDPERIALEPALSAVENAERYYDRARRSREARNHAAGRLDASLRELEMVATMREELASLRSAREVEAYRKSRADMLGSYMKGDASSRVGVPFRRILVDGDLEVWVGRNAAQNDSLTLRHARKHDLWFHARGVGGSHVVLRLPGRQTRPSRRAIEQAAAIAALYSEARHSSLVPVQMTERRYVRKPKGADPGAVVVDREEVLMVEPGLPEGRR